MLKGEKVTLRALEYTDLDNLRKWRNDIEIRHRTREFKLLSQCDQEKWFESLHGSRFPDNLMFGVTVPSVGVDKNISASTLIGVVGLCWINWKDRNAEISFYTGNYSFRKKGHCTDALKTVISYGFNELGLKRVWAEAYAYNEPCMKTLTPLGFKEEGRLRSVKFVDGQFHDSIISAVLDHEWKPNGGR